MSIVINQQPNQFTPAYNPMPFVVTSSNVAQPNFNYIFDLYIGGLFFSRHRMPPRPGLANAVFDPSSIVEGQVTHDIAYSLNDFDFNPDSWIKFNVAIREEYDISGVTTLSAILATSGDKLAINAVYDYLDFAAFDTSAMLNLFLTDIDKKFLTSSPDQKVMITDKAWLHFMVQQVEIASPGLAGLRVKTYSATGTLINNSLVTPPTYSITEAEQFQRVGCGPVNILATLGSTFLNGAAYYTVNMEAVGPAQISEIKKFTIDYLIPRYTNYRLHFLNKKGGFDAFNFKLSSRKNSNIKRTKYKKVAGSISLTGYTYSASDRISTTMNTDVDDVISVTSDWISDAEATWLLELLDSPIVFHELNGVLVPVTVEADKYETQMKANEKLFNLQLDFSYTFTNHRQRY